MHMPCSPSLSVLMGKCESCLARDRPSSCCSLCLNLKDLADIGTAAKPSLHAITGACRICLSTRLSEVRRGLPDRLLCLANANSYASGERCTLCDARVALLKTASSCSLRLCSHCATVFLGQLAYPMDDFEGYTDNRRAEIFWTGRPGGKGTDHGMTRRP